MKKMMFGTAALTAILIIGMTGLLSATFYPDDISNQRYRILLNRAATITKKEIKKRNTSSIHFMVEKELDNPTNAIYECQSFCEGQVIIVNPTTGKATMRNHTEKTAEPLPDIEKTEEFKQSQTVMKEAVSYYGKKAKMKEWATVVKDE